MPFFLGTPKALTNSLIFDWGESYDFNAQDISYHFVVSTDWEFKNIVCEASLTNQTSITIDSLKSGTYFWRVTATNENGKTQYPFDNYWDADRIPHSGLKYFYITAEGKVLEE